MIKQLRTYEHILGLTDFDEWSYCEKDQMWYEDAIEILPQPEQESEFVSDLVCEIKVNYFAGMWLDASNWDELEEERNDLEDYARYVIGVNNGQDSIGSAFLLKTPKQDFVTGFGSYGICHIENFVQKLKTQSYAAEYMDTGGALKFLGWTDENNQTRFVLYSYNINYKYLQILFDITLDRDILIKRLEDIIEIWCVTIYNAIVEQEEILNEYATNPHGEYVINHFFPEFRAPVNNIINMELSSIEYKYGVKVLFAVENGSRAWNMASKNSDYDVRFVFKKDVKKYLSMKPGKDVIEKYLDEEYCTCSADKALIDMVGFDIKKYMELLAKSNPTSIEWLMSDLVYCGSNDLPIKQHVIENFNPKTLICHYVSLCYKQYNRYIKENKNVTHKKYLYVMRGLLNALYVYKKDLIPPLDFTQTLELLKDDIPVEIYEKVKEIIKIKSSGLEQDKIERIKVLDSFVEENLNKVFEVPERSINIYKLDYYMQEEILRDINLRLADLSRKKSLWEKIKLFLE